MAINLELGWIESISPPLRFFSLSWPHPTHPTKFTIQNVQFFPRPQYLHGLKRDCFFKLESLGTTSLLHFPFLSRPWECSVWRCFSRLLVAQAKGPGGRLCATAVLESPEERKSFVCNEARGRGAQHPVQRQAAAHHLLASASQWKWQGAGFRSTSALFFLDSA